MSSFLTITVIAGSAWLSAIAGTMIAGEFELACEIFLYGGLIGWALVMVVAPRLAEADARAWVVRAQSPYAHPDTLPKFSHLLGLTALATALVGGSVGMLIAGNTVAASVIPLSAIAGGAVIHLGSKSR